MNRRPSGYEPDELPGCSTPHQKLFELFKFYCQSHSSTIALKNNTLLQFSQIEQQKKNAHTESNRESTFTTHKLVPRAGLEPARAWLTTPSRWRVYQFHHLGNNLLASLLRSSGLISRFHRLGFLFCSLSLRRRSRYYHRSFRRIYPNII